MAGPGRTPKPPGQRHGHRAKAEKRPTIVEATERFGAPPPLPEWCADQLCGPTKEWYAAWCSSPQAAMFTPSDWQRLHMVALLVDEFFEIPSRRGALMGEIRLNESLLGATPVDRLRLNWQIEPVKEPSKLDDIKKRPRVTDPTGIIDLSASDRPRVTDPPRKRGTAS